MPAQNHNNNNSKVNGIKIKNNFLDLVDAGPETIAAILEDAIRRKGQRAGRPKGEPDKDAPLAGYTLGMIFEKNSTRTRVSFDMAMQQLGGVAKVLDANGMQLGRGETMADTGRVLSRYLDGLMVRTDYHEKIVELAEYASIPVINGLTDKSHPCQIMADLMTVKEHFGQLAGTRWAWLGDGNNVLYSIIEAASLMGFELAIGCPDGHEPCPEVMAAAQKRGGQAKVRLVREPRKAVEGANVIVTDTWFSMGQKPDPQKLRAIQPYQVTPELMAAASKDAIFLHCLPAHRGEEVLESVIDGPQSLVWDEAENRLHAQKSVLLWAFGKLSI